MLLFRWLRRLFRFSKNSRGKRPEQWPTQEQIRNLPPFEALNLIDIETVSDPKSAHRAYAEISVESVVGFDSESKPTFCKGEVSTGPHTLQFSTPYRAYVFLLHEAKCREIAIELIVKKELMKVGFGLRDDLRFLRVKFNIQPLNVLDLQTLFKEKGFGEGVGVKVGLALLFQRRFIKSKKIGTSNWSNPVLTNAQLLYAGNDAFAAISAYNALTSKQKMYSSAFSRSPII